MKKRFFVVTAIIISSQLQAQSDTTGQSLGEVVLTSNKYPKKQTETGKVITVITRQQLEKSGGKTLSEVLNTVAGTTIIGANNNAGTNQTVSLRGASSGNTLVLLDGIPVNDPSVISNYFDLNFINLDQVERVEILKGGQSTLYGSDAVAGVINIISRKAAAKKIGITGDFAVGSYTTVKESLGLSGSIQQTNYSVNYTHVNSRGFSTAHDANKTGLFDNDKYNQHVLNSRLSFPIVRKLKATIFSNYSVYKTGLDASAFTDDRDYTVTNKNVQVGGGLVYNLSKGDLHVNYSFNRSGRSYLDDSFHVANPGAAFTRSRYVGRTHFVELYNSWKWQQIELLAGADYRYNNTDQEYFSIGSFGPYAPPVLHAKMNQVSPYASIVYKPTMAFNVELGGRWNNHSEYGSNFSFTLNPSYTINNRVKIFANLYSAFKTPTLYQLFDLSSGNADLDPEKNITGEAGFSVNSSHGLKFRLVGFYRKAKDAITYTFDPNTFAGKYVNVSEQTNYGTELEASYIYQKWTITANYTYTDGKTTSPFDGTGSPLGKDTSYFNLYRIPKHAINLNLGIQATKSLYISAAARTVSKREEFIYGSTPVSLKSYTTVDLFGQYRFDKVIRVFLDLRNILNKEYFDIRGYNSRKFNFTTGVSFQL